MARDRVRNDLRSRITHLAARIMAEDGIEDYALAKRKAARQAGVADSRQLPTNQEIDDALRAYQELYQPDEHRIRLRELRSKAIKVMRELEQFNPHLTGSVLNGNAGKFANIDLQLYTDNPKSVELFLIDREIPYKTAQSRLYAGGELRTFPLYTVNDGAIEILVTVLATDELRTAIRKNLDGRNIERAKLRAVEQLLAQT